MLKIFKDFEIKECKLEIFLEFQIQIYENSILIYQSHYILNMLQKFNMIYYNSISTPMDPTQSNVCLDNKIPKFPHR